MKTQVKWAVSLSNGETVYEDKGEYKEIIDELSPWQRLLKHTEKEGLKITSLSLYTNEGQRFNLPSAGRNPKFKEFAEAEKPTGYRMFRKIGADIKMEGTHREIESQELYTVAEAIYPDKKLQIWVSEQDRNICWSVII